MRTMPDTRPGVTAGVDTHRDQHVVAALDQRGAELGIRAFPSTPAGHRALLAWLRGLGTVARCGVEGTGSYGASLTRYLHAEDVPVVEVNRPNRQRRRRHGKSDPVDALAAARSAQAGDAVGEAKTRTGPVEAIRALRVARRSAVHGRTTAINQMRALLVTGPSDLRERLRGSTVATLVTTAARLRPADPTTVVGATKLALRELARRVLNLEAECQGLEAVLEPLVATTAPDLIAARGGGHRHGRRRCSSPPATTRSACTARPPSPTFAASPPSTPPPGSPAATASTAVGIAAPIRPAGGSSWSAWPANPAPVPTWPAGPPRAAPNARSSVRSSATSRATFIAASHAPNNPLDER